jgi:cobalt-zinc-cadmium efflux system membrane fusion protein
VKPIRIIIFLVVLIVGAGAIYWTSTQASKTVETDPGGHGHGHGHDDHAEGEEEKGPHGGRMLEDGEFALEITIFESGVPPEFRVYPSFEHQPVPPDAVDLTITLSRLGGREDVIKFKPAGDFLLGDRPVEEPHSFEVEVDANYQGKNHHFHYDSPEGRTELSAEAQSRAGIKIEQVASATMLETLNVYGRVQLNEERFKHISPRYSGVLIDANKHFGNPVAKGEVIARVESNDSLREYPINSSIAGEVIWVHAHEGEFVKEGQPIYEVADLSSLWVELDIFSHDLGRVKVGQNVRISFGEELPTVESKIDYLSPFGSEKSQTTLARVVVDNSEGLLRAGMFATAAIELAQTEVPITVPLTALQTFRDWDVVFLVDGNVFQAQPVELGRRDETRVEILEGLNARQTVVTDGSFILKADIMKAGAVHEH